MAINNKTLSSIQSQVTGLTTNETDFRTGLDDTLVQVNASEILLSNVDAADLIKLSEVTATSSELSILENCTATTSDLNKIAGLDVTHDELNILNGVTADYNEINKLDGLDTTKTELNKLHGFTGTSSDLNKISGLTATSTDIEVLSGFVSTHEGTTADLLRCIELDAAGNGTENQVLTSDGVGGYTWTTPSSFTFVVEDEDGTEIAVDTDELKFTGDGMTIDWGDGNGTDGNPFILQFDNTDKGSSQNIFKNIAVSDQTTVSANTNNDTLNLSGSGIDITTDEASATVTFSPSTNSIGPSELKVTGNGTTSQYLRSDGDGTFTWATPPDTDTTYSAGTNLELSGTEFSVVASPTFTNVTVTGTLTETSDSRLKSSIQKVEGGLDKVCALSGYTFIKEGQDHRSVGVIAQEVLAVLPEAVTGTADTNYSVAYGNLVGLLIEAIKDLKAEVDELKNK